MFTIRGYHLFVDHLSSPKSHDIENTSDENQDSSSEEEAIKKDAKEFVSIFEDMTPSTLARSIHPSQHWSIYSLVVFKEPLRDVLTPPPNFI
ncbi:MAG: hypothetical protein JST68_21715 [Bacteroidetes bacterium]|nr:hypothetical protein [Bacteroidota bacterium]